MNYEPIGYLVFVVLVVCAWWIFFVEQQRCWLDRTRQSLFKNRDDLFDAALRGEIAFDHPAYVMTRKTLNGMIQFTHEVNILYFLSIYFTHKFVYRGRRSTDYSEKFGEAINALPNDAKRLVLRSIAHAHLTVLRHVMSTSPVLWPILKPLSIIVAMFKQTTKMRKWAMRGKKRKHPWEVLDAEANYIGRHIAH